jgi:cystathionine beta-lyase/cystathionine gamma-synthase
VTDPVLGASRPLVLPLYPAAVYTLPDLDALDRIMNNEEPGFIYARDGHPNGHELATRLAELEKAPWGLVAGSGMAAVTAGLTALLQSGDRVVASDKLYGRTAQLLQQELSRFGVATAWVDVTDLHAVNRALQEPARILFVETMSNPLLRLADLERLADLAYSRGVKFVVDNTFATPLLVRPLELGADLVVESLTKLIGGHSDVTLGAVCGTDPDLLPAIGQVISIWGMAAPPFDCWLALRGLGTLAIRVQAASANAAVLADWLARRSGVSRVVYPGRTDHPDHALARRLMPLGYGNMLCFELAGGRDAVNRFLRQSGPLAGGLQGGILQPGAPGVPFSPSLGHTGTTCSYPAGTSHRYVSPAERKRQGITDGLVRLSVGVEALELIQAELARGLS